jgi:hypothetical protein
VMLCFNGGSCDYITTPSLMTSDIIKSMEYSVRFVKRSSDTEGEERREDRVVDSRSEGR